MRDRQLVSHCSLHCVHDRGTLRHVEQTLWRVVALRRPQAGARTPLVAERRVFRWHSLSFLIAVMAVAAALLAPATATGATPITVAQAIGQQNGASATVRGYVVGQPTATNTVVR